MQPQNNNVYSLDIVYPGVDKPEVAGAAAGGVIGCCAGHAVEGCIIGATLAKLYGDSLSEPYRINTGGIGYSNRTISLHMPTIQRINRD
ncbi:hypothetical protein [Thalassotalea sp. G20_0]|uniref:hypothetical protein n=1 Tax=Thalassotalea sp. G20_0 TaxID=2821093 RepID=UPI001ADB8C29|nr:hypothetical protein [Thalassotalea sp. G20_0]